jgi:hypothetical protein
MWFAWLLVLSQALADPPALADALETAYLDKLIAAHDARAVRDVSQAYARMMEDQRICDIQENTDTIPWACYRLLAREKRWRLHNASQSSSRRKELDRRCRAVTKRLLISDDDAFDVPEDSLSEECRHWTGRARETARYRRRKIGADLE